MTRRANQLLGYAAANGYFPCPADSASNGQEAVATNHNTGACPVWQGFLPAAVLGLTSTDAQGYAIDAWGVPANRIRYAVSNHTIAGTTDPFTRMCGSAAGVVSGTSCGTAPTLVSTTPVVVWSVGSNATSGGVSADEAQNPNPNGGSEDRIFVSRVRNEVAGYELKAHAVN